MLKFTNCRNCDSTEHIQIQQMLYSGMYSDLFIVECHKCKEFISFKSHSYILFEEAKVAWNEFMKIHKCNHIKGRGWLVNDFNYCPKCRKKLK